MTRKFVYDAQMQRVRAVHRPRRSRSLRWAALVFALAASAFGLNAARAVAQPPPSGAVSP